MRQIQKSMCPECDAELPEDSRYCRNCGVRLIDANLGISERVDLVCPRCGEVMLYRLSYYFCPRDDLLIRKA